MSNTAKTLLNAAERAEPGIRDKRLIDLAVHSFANRHSVSTSTCGISLNT